MSPAGEGPTETSVVNFGLQLRTIMRHEAPVKLSWFVPVVPTMGGYEDRCYALTCEGQARMRSGGSVPRHVTLGGKLLVILTQLQQHRSAHLLAPQTAEVPYT